MFVDSTTLMWADLIITGVLGTIATPFIIYGLSQNRDRKKELAAAFESVRDQRDVDQKHVAEALGDMRDRTTKLQTTVDIKKETVDRVQNEQNTAGVRIAVVETAIKAITDSQTRSEQNWQKVSEKLDSLGRIEEQVKNIVGDVSELRQAQNRN